MKAYRTTTQLGTTWEEKVFIFEDEVVLKEFFTKQKIADIWFKGNKKKVKHVDFTYIGMYVNGSGFGSMRDEIKLVPMGEVFFNI